MVTRTRRKVKQHQAPMQINMDKYPLFQAYSELTNRMKFAGQAGSQYGGDRDVYQALGYPQTSELDYEGYHSRYKRQDIAKAVIDRPVKASWKGDLSVIENAQKDETPFEKTWKELYAELNLKNTFVRADKLTGIGKYSVLLLGTSDIAKREDFLKPIRKRGRKKLELIYVKPFSEYSAKIQKLDDDITSKRYGKPEIYEINVSVKDKGPNSIENVLHVHHSRVIHLVEDILENEVYGTPRLESIYNRLMDLEKLVGGDAEMFWRGARPGYTGEVKPDYQMTTTALKDLEAQIDEFEHNMRRVLINEGVDYKAFDQQIADPLNHVDIQFQMISAVTGIPKRILMGSERGELSSSQDKQEWVGYVAARREEQNEPMILKPFIDKLREIGILPSVEYTVVWDKLIELTPAEKVSMGKERSIALKEYSMNPYAQEIVPLDLYMKFFLGLDDFQIQQIMDRQGEEVDREMPMTDREAAELKVKTTDMIPKTGERKTEETKVA